MGANSTERQSSILNPEDQQIAQDLFDHTRENDGEVVLPKGDELTTAVINENIYGSPSMELNREGSDIGHVTLHFRRGKSLWRDDGAIGFSGSYGDLSQFGPVPYHPDEKTRDKVLREVYVVLVAPPTPPNES